MSRAILAQQLASLIIVGSPFLVYSFAFSSYARADNRPKLAMTGLAVGSASNILLDYVFLYPLNMGIGGAALATALVPVFLAIFPWAWGGEAIWWALSAAEAATFAAAVAWCRRGTRPPR